jgi:hypothetical protein
MRYVTHQFAHVDTLERARRWLVLAGIVPSRIQAHTHGIPRLAVSIESGESAEVERVIDVAEFSDPDGQPGFWELASHRHVYPQADAAASITDNATHSHSFVVGWHPQDAGPQATQTDTGVELLKHYQEERD